MHLLVDGYNLLFALGMLPKQVKPGDLQSARQALLTWLAASLGSHASGTTVVFDSSQSKTELPTPVRHQGLEVRFTSRREEADDLIEQLIHTHPQPHKLTVLTSDQRLHKAARRRGAHVVRSEEALAWLEQLQQQAQPKPKPTPPAPPPAESDYWLKQFEHLDHDPQLGSDRWFDFE